MRKMAKNWRGEFLPFLTALGTTGNETDGTAIHCEESQHRYPCV